MSHDPSTSDSPAAQTRWGILSTGWIAEQFTGDLNLTGHRVTAVGSRSTETAEKFAAKFSIPQAHGTYEQLVTDPNVDIVYIGTPHPRHHDDAALALRAGKHVLLEKPFTINAAEAQNLVDLAEDRGLVILEAMWTRWLPHMLEIRRLIAEGAIGEIRSILCDHTQNLPEDPAHRINALELGGGALLDLGVYPISLSSDLLGTPTAIDAVATFKDTGADAETAILLRHTEGRMAVLSTASNAPGPNRAAIIGREGRIEIDSVWYNPATFRLYDADGGLVSTYNSDVPGRGMQFQAVEAERLIASGLLESEILPHAESVSIMATMDRIREQIGLRYPTE